MTMKYLIPSLAASAALLLPTSAQLVINEVVASTTGTDAEFIELYNTTAAPVDMTGWTIEVYNSNDGASFGTLEATFPLGTATIPANGFYLLGSPEFQADYGITPDASFTDESIPNSSLTMILKDNASAAVYSAFMADDDLADSPNDAGAAITPDISVGPDGSFFPAGYSLLSDGGTTAFILEFSPSPAPSATPTASVDIDPPAVTSLSPANGALLSSLPTELILSLNEIVDKNTGTITLYDASDDSVVQAFDITSTSGDISVLGGQILLIPNNPLDFGTSYYVLADVGVVEDQTGNPFAGIGVGEWEFSTSGTASLGSSGPLTQDFSAFVSLETLPDGWSSEGPDQTYDGDWGSGTTGGFRGNASVLGYQHTSSTDTLIKKLLVSNDTGSEITDLTISYLGRVERATQGRSPAYEVAVDDIVVPALAYSTLEGDNVLKEASVSGLSIPAGAVFTITWTSDRGEPSGSSRQIGISSLSIDVGSTAQAPSLGLTEIVLGSITSSGADVSSEVVAEGSSPVSAMGFVFSETAVDVDPELGETGVTDVPDGFPGVFPFFASLTGLSAETEYAVRSYATNTEGTAYSPVVVFSTLASAPSFTGTYSEAFDAFDGTFPAGWTGITSGGANSFGGDWGSGSSAGFRGNVSNPGVVGYQHTSSSGTLDLTLRLVNDTGAAITELNFSYLGRVERSTEGRSPEWTVLLDGVAVPELTYSTLDGIDKTVAATVTGLNIASGAEFEVIWSSDRGLPGGASRQIGLADLVISTDEIVMDDFSTWATANGIPGEGFDGDSDQDGIPTGVEYAIDGLDPNAVDSLASAFDGSTLSFTKRAEAVANGDVIYAIEESTDLGVSDPWEEATTGYINNATMISFDLPTGQTRIFARLFIDQAGGGS